MFWFWAFEKEKKKLFECLGPGPLKRLPTYLYYIGLGPNVVRKKVLKNEVLKNIFWNEVSFWVIVTKPLKRLPMYLSQRGLGLDVVGNNVLKNEVLKNPFWNEVSFRVFVTGPLKRLPTYLSHRGSSPNVLRKKKKILKNEVLKIFFF